MDFWNPITGKYKLSCSTCAREFYGRKNQLYCNITCKSKAANDKASLINSLVNGEVNAMKRNCYILQQLFRIKKEIDSVTLIGLGFKTKSAHKKLQIKEKRMTIFSYGSYGILPLNEESTQFEIIKLKDHGTG